MAYLYASLTDNIRKLKHYCKKTRICTIRENNCGFMASIEERVTVKVFLKANTHINCVSVETAETFLNGVYAICISSKMDA